jgi:tRNA A37 methylthiotransferase MiaB
LTNDNKELFYCVNDINEAVDKINTNKYDFVLMSLMNANQHMIKQIISVCKEQKFLVGGYNDAFMHEMEKELKNVTICDTTSDTAFHLGVEYRFGTDYTLFKKENTIPRLTLSYGCLNNCKFCIVPHKKLTEVPNDVIFQQVDSFSHLNYRLIYIDDKTFGQAPNYHIIKEITEKHNKDFNGFIVQTTTGMVVRNGDYFKDIGVKVVEIGLETYNDVLLREYRKPSTEKLIRESILAAEKSNIMLIANLIIGLDGETEETYKRTYDFVMPLLEKGKLIGINPAIYTDYSNDENLGEINFMQNKDYELNIKWWNKFNNTASEILSK